MKGSRTSALLLVTFAGALSVARAETISAQRIAATVRLIPLKKVTVGPDDQYHGIVDPTGRTLVFTRKSDLAPHLCRQDMTNGEVSDLLPLTADSQDPAISPNGRVAFTYYRFNARGDICYRDLPGPLNTKITCLKANPGEQSTPFWRGEKELGYLLRDPETLESKILVENIETGAKTVLAEGKVWSPAMRTGGRYLVYNEMIDSNAGPSRVLVLKDLQGGIQKSIRLELPGISAFPALSADEKYLYFSHYLNDTNHDNIIDGNDNSVVFRTTIESLLKSEGPIFPEQLTSVENNCSFPRPHQDQLFVTCAFEGSLDIYQLPVTGVVPVKWEESHLLNARQTSRTYQERTLLLNTLKFRFRDRVQPDLEERLLSDHLLADDTTAAKFYLSKLQATSSPNEKGFYDLLQLYLVALEKKRSQPSATEVSSAFMAEILDTEKRVEKIQGPARLKIILRGLLRSFLNQPQQSWALLKSIHFDSPSQPLVHPMERNFYFELASWTLPRVKQAGPELTAVYHQMITAPELTEESQIYYAFRYQQHLQDQKLSRKERVQALDAMNKEVSPAISALLQSEAFTLKLIEAPTEDGKSALYRELDKLMAASQADYFLRKALYVRAILNFTSAAEFNYLSLIATNWLRYTSGDDTEFANAREVYANATLDQAYDSLGKKQYKLADNYFYGALSLTDDLEAHSGFLRSLMLENERAIVEPRYQNLQKRQFIDDNMKFVESLLILLDAHPKARGDVNSLDSAIEKLKAMQQDRDSPVRYLLLGSCYLDRLLRLASGYDFDAATFENANRSLMLAYDLGRQNLRIRAAALMDLALLHQRVQNHGLAAKFFAKRKELGFLTTDDEARFAWFYSRSLFYSNQPDKAADELARVISPDATKALVPLLDRQAFYLQAAGRFAPAVQAYQKLLTRASLPGDLNPAKANLGLGYSFFKLGKVTEARAALKRSLEHADPLRTLPKSQDRLGDFLPVRLKLNAYGLLARMGPAAERIDALEKRYRLLSGSDFGKDGIYFEDGSSLLVQNRLQLAALAAQSDPSRAVRSLEEALHLAEKITDSGQSLSHAVFEATVDYLEHAIMHPGLYQKADNATAQRLVEKSVHAYETQRTPQPVLEKQKLKLQLLWAAFSARILKPSEAQANAQSIQTLLAHSQDHGGDLKPLAAKLTQLLSAPP